MKGVDTFAGSGVQQGSGLIQAEPTGGEGGGGGESSVDALRGKSCVRHSQEGGNKYIIKTKPAGARVVDGGSPGGSNFMFSCCGRHGGRAGLGVLLLGPWLIHSPCRQPGLKSIEMTNSP